jgi:hypothetical protein
VSVRSRCRRGCRACRVRSTIGVCDVRLEPATP